MFEIYAVILIRNDENFMTKKRKNSKIELLVARIIPLERFNVFFRPKAVENMAIYRPSLCNRLSSLKENNL